jgi:hypothetical protein
VKETGRRRGRANRAAAILIVLGAIGAALTGCGGGGRGSSEQARTAASLARKDLASKPRQAALLALAADRIEPSVPAELSMLSVALKSAGVERVLGNGGSPLTSAIRSEHLVVGVEESGAVRVWRPSGQLVGEAHMPQPAVDLADSSFSSSVAAIDGRGGLSLMDLTDPRRPVVDALHPPLGDGRPLAISFAEEAAAIDVVTSHGTVERFDSSSGRLLDRWSLREASGDLPWSGAHAPLRLSAATFRSEGDDGEEGLLVATADGAVARITVAGRSGRTILGQGVVPGRVVSLAGSSYTDHLAVASTGGLTTLRGLDAKPVVTRGAFASGVGFDLEDNLWIGDREGVHSQPASQPSLRGSFVGAPATRISVGAGGVLATGADGSISLLGKPTAGLGLGEIPTTAVAVFDPEGNLLTEEGTPGYVSQLETQRPGHGHIEDGYAPENPDVQNFEPDPEWLSEEEEGLYVDAAAIDRRFVVVGGQDKTAQGVLMVWNARSGAPLRRLAVTSGHAEKLEPSVVTGVVLLPGKALVAAYSPVQKVVVFWSTKTWKFVGAVPVGNLKSLQASPGEEELMGVEVPAGEPEAEPTSAQSRLVFIDVGEKRVDHSVPVESALAAAWSPSGNEIAVADGEHAVRLLSADGRSPAGKSVRVPGTPVALAWRPDGKAIAVSLGDGVVLVDPATRVSSSRLPRTPGQLVAALDWSPDGRFLAASTIEPEAEGESYEPGPALLWTIAAPRLRRRMCQLAGGGLGSAEWRRLLGDSDPRPLCRTPRLPRARQEPREIPAGLDPILAFRSEGDLFVVDRDGRKIPIGKVREDALWPPAALWTDAGLSWSGHGGVGLLRGGATRAESWPCACAGAVAARNALVALENKGKRLLVFTPGHRLPRSVAIAGNLGDNVHLLGMLGGRAIVSAFRPDPEGTTESTLYAVDRHGHLASIGVDRDGVPSAPTAQSPAGDELAFTSANLSGDCGAPGGVGLVRVDEAGRMHVSYPPLPFGDEGKVVRSIVVDAPGQVESAFAPDACSDEEDDERPPLATRYVLGGGGWAAAAERGFDVQRHGGSVVTISRPPTLTAGGELTMRSPSAHTVRVAAGVDQLWVRP